MRTKKILNWALADTLICGASVFTACSSDDDDSILSLTKAYVRNKF